MSLFALNADINTSIRGYADPCSGNQKITGMLINLHMDWDVFAKTIKATGTITIETIATDRPCSARIEVKSGSIVLTTTFSSDDGNIMLLKVCASAMNTMLRRTINADTFLDDAPRAKVLVEFSTLSLLRSLRFYPTLSLDNLLNKTRSERKLKFKDSTRAVLHALTDTVLADNPSYPEYKHSLVERIEQDVSHNLLAFRTIILHVGIINCISMIRYGRSFCNVSPQRRRILFAGLLSSKSFLNKVLGNLLCLPVKYYHAASTEVHESLGLDYYKEKIAPEPQPRWMKQIFPANTFEHENVMEADVVVVGTGAGGAVVAKELAEKGFAVAIIEAGNFYRRESFNGNPKEMMHILYRGEGLTFSIGNSLIALPMGKAVGGSTLINSGTCFRTPDAILNQWAKNGLHDFSPDKMAPYYERVEEIIHVQDAEQKYIGPIGEIIKKGCSTYGYSCGPLKRNAIDCDGQGVCTQGCPKDAKQSTNITYIPKALDAAAALFSGFEVQDILTDGNRAVGVAAVGKGKHGDQVHLKCYAKAVILSCGTLITPGVIQRNHLRRGNTWVGSNLSVHPAAYVGAVFPGYDMRNPCSIPQGYMIDEFHEQGIMFEGATAPFMPIATILPGIGQQYEDLLHAYTNLALFGFMVKDTSTGFVRPGLGGIPLIYYNLNRDEMQRLIKAMNILCEVFFAAGAQYLMLPTLDDPIVNSKDDLQRVRDRKWKPRDLLLSAYHPLGTAKIGHTNNDSAINMNYECHNVPGLFVVDGSSVPGSLGVNPQLTIMAMATQAADKIARLLH